MHNFLLFVYLEYSSLPSPLRLLSLVQLISGVSKVVEKTIASKFFRKTRKFGCKYFLCDEVESWRRGS